MFRLALFACAFVAVYAAPQIIPNLAVPGGDLDYAIRQRALQQQRDLALNNLTPAIPGADAHRAAEAEVYRAQGLAPPAAAPSAAEAAVQQAERDLIALQLKLAQQNGLVY